MKKTLSQMGVWGTLLALIMSLFWPAPLEASTSGAGAVYTAPLSGGEEVPSRTTPGSGQADFQVSADGQSLTYTVTVNNITNVTMGHIHLGAKGTNGDIVLPLVPTAPPAGGQRSGTIGQGTAVATQLVGPLQGKTMADLIAQLDAGNAYVNIHTARGTSPATLQPGDIPPGEIRGQIIPTIPVVAPTTMPSTGGGYRSRPPVIPWVVLTAILTIGLTALLRAQRRTTAAPRMPR